MKTWKLKFISLRIMLNTAFLNMIFFNRHSKFSLILELFPLHISLCGSYLEASKPSFLVRPKQYIYLHLAFLQTHFFGRYGFIFFRDEPVAHLSSPGAFSLLSLPPSSSVTTPSKCSTPCTPSLLSGKSLTPPASFSPQPSFLLGDFSCFSCYNNHALFY